MCDSTFPMICFYNGKTMRIETTVKYVGNKVVIRKASKYLPKYFVLFL